mgnify:FL=1
MISNDRKLIIILLTLMLDLSFIYILATETLNSFDYKYINSLLFIHVIFILAMFYNKKLLIDVCHGLIFVAIYLGLVVENMKILLILFSLSVIQCILKYIFGECILCTSDLTMFGKMVDEYNQYCVYLIIGLLLYKILM